MATLQLKTNEQNFVNGLKKASGSVGELAGNLNVKLANSFKSADFYSKNFEKGIGRLSSAFKEAGQGMTLGLTLPLGFLAKSASDAYGELDSLKRALSTVEPTAGGLSSKLKELREVAKAPGIGFQEAIQGEVRLRSVGVSATISTKILKEFANAIAMTGGGKAQLNEVTTQLAQMYNKGKVMAQDFRSIMENAPAIGSMVKAMFGTTNSEDITKSLEAQGKSSVDFISMLLAEMEKAPRVTGGWKNSLENLSDTLLIAKADIFEVADKVFDLGGKLASVTTTVESFVEGFKNLPEPVQKVILGMTALVAILGPASYGLGLLANGIALAVTAAGMATLGIGALVAIVGTLAFAMFSSAVATEQFNKTTQDLSKTKQEAVRDTDKEVSKLQDLITVIQKGSTKTTEFKNAKQELLRINPEYKAALVGETVDYAKLNDVTSKTVTNLMRIAEKKKLLAQQEAALAAVSELRSGGGITAEESLTALLSSDVTEIYEKRIKKFGGLLDYEKQLVYNKTYKLLSTVQDINAELKKEYADVLIPSDTPRGKPSSGISTGSNGISDAEQALAEFLKIQEDSEERITQGIKKKGEDRADVIDAINKLHEAKRNDGLVALLQYYSRLAGIETITDEDTSENKVYKELGLSPPDKLKEAWDKRIAAMMEGQAKELEVRKKGYEDASKDAERKKKQTQEDINEFAVDMMSGIAESIIGGDSFNSILKQSLTALGNFAIQLGKQYYTIAKLKDLIFKKGLTQNSALGLIAGGIIVKGLASRMTIPKLAQGGMATNPTLAMIGDNKSGKEMVLPFERTGEFANMIASKMGGGGGDFIHTTRISGNDLLILTERAKRAR